MGPKLGINSLYFFLGLALLFSCKAEYPTVKSAIQPIQFVNEEKEEGEMELRRKLRTREDQLLKLKHMDLWIDVDFQEEKISGKSRIFLEPYFYPVDTLRLDAKYLFITSCRVDGDSGETPFSYNSKILTIPLSRQVLKGEMISVELEYSVDPSLARDRMGKAVDGLFFVTSQSGKEIWSQNETESASTWFPTIDHPSQRFTHDIFLSVDSGMVTLSNGSLISAQTDSLGNKTDHWKMDIPHPPYLVMIAAGFFSKSSHTHKGLTLEYMMDPLFAETADYLFGRTPAMLDFIDSLTGVKYPWQKYSQLVVHDFVTGAMENTSASVFHEGLNMDVKSLVDDYQDDIIIHELAHQWFGDYVTCADWGSVALNEGFATYFEYLWYEHTEGKEVADLNGYNEVWSYLEQSRIITHPLIWDSYRDANEDLFDDHSYAKASRILHMLRREVGDEAFWASVNHYLKENSLSSVVASDLQSSFEKVTGRNLSTFFEQWFYREGHPKIKTKFEFKEGTTLVEINQIQDGNTPFHFSFDLDLFYADTILRRTFTMDEWEQQYSIPWPDSPVGICFDPEMELLFEPSSFTDIDYEAMRLKRISNPALVYHLGYDIEDSLSISQKRDLASDMIQNDAWFLRSLGLDFYLDIEEEIDFNDQEIASFRKMATDDPEPMNRGSAIDLLKEENEDRDIFKRSLTDTSWYVNSGALLRMMDFEQDPFLLPGQLQRFKQTYDENMIYAMAQYLTKYFPGTNYSWFKEKSWYIGRWDQFWFYDFLCQDVEMGPEESADRSLEWLKELATESKESLRFFLLARLEDMTFEKAGKVYAECLEDPVNAEYQSWDEKRKNQGK